MQEYDILKAPLPELQRAEQSQMRKLAEAKAAEYEERGEPELDATVQKVQKFQAMLKEFLHANPR